MEFPGHCRSTDKANGCSGLTLQGKITNVQSPALRRGGMVFSISRLTTLTFFDKLRSTFAHHHIETTLASRHVPVSGQWLLDRHAPYASFSFHSGLIDLSDISCLSDHTSTIAYERPGNLDHPVVTNMSWITHPIGTSFSSSEGVSECHSDVYYVLFSAKCISDILDRVHPYPLSGSILFDTLLIESLARVHLCMTDIDDPGQTPSDDALRVESAPISRNGGVVAAGHYSYAIVLCIIFYGLEERDPMRTDRRQDSFSFMPVNGPDMTDSTPQDHPNNTVQVRAILADYAAIRKMLKPQLTKYAEGDLKDDHIATLVVTAIAAGESNLKPQLADLASEIASLNAKLTEAQGELARAETHHTQVVTSLTGKLTAVRQVVWDIRTAVNGSFWGRLGKIREAMNSIRLDDA